MSPVDATKCSPFLETYRDLITEDRKKHSLFADRFREPSSLEKPPVTEQESPKKSSLFTRKTMLLTCAALCSLAALALIYSNQTQPGGDTGDASSPQGSFTSEDGAGENEATNSFEVFGFGSKNDEANPVAAVKNAVSNLVEAASDIALSTIERVKETAQNFGMAAFNQMYGIPTTLERQFMTPHQFRVLFNREQTPQAYQSGFLTRALGGFNSSIVKTIALAAALGEAPALFTQVCALKNAHWCPLSEIGTNITEINDTFNPQIKGKQAFVLEQQDRAAKLNQTIDEENLDKMYDKYSRGVKERKQKLAVVSGLVDDTTFRTLRNNYIVEFKGTSKNERFHYQQRKQDFGTNPFVDPAQNDKVTRNERLEVKDAENENKVNEKRMDWDARLSGDRNTLHITRRFFESYNNKKDGNAYTLECEQPEANQIRCETAPDGPLQHAYGELEYGIHEEIKGPHCSLIEEHLRFPSFGRDIVHQYAVDPSRELPLFFSQFVHSENFLKNRLRAYDFSLIAATTINSKMAVSVKYPDNLPRTCEELEAEDAERAQRAPQITQNSTD